MKHDYIHELFSQTAERFPSSVALTSLDECITYGELEARTNNLANYFNASGVSKGSLVGILARHTIPVTTAILGILKAGGVFVPFDPELPLARLRVMLSEASPDWFIVEPDLLPTLDSMLGETTVKVNTLVLDPTAPLAEVSERITVRDYHGYWNPAKPQGTSEPDDMCYIYFTSGSTGKPKGIAGRLKAIDHFIRWEIETCGIRAGTRVSQLTTPSFDAFLRDIFVPLCAGGTVCVPARRGAALPIETLLDWLNDQQVYLIHCVPSLFRAILSADLRPNHFSALKYILLAGEPLLPADVKRWLDIYGDRVQLVNLYGPSETTMVKFYHFVQPADKDQRSIPIGKPMPGTRAIVLDEQSQICPTDVVGEIYIRTPFRALGYYHQPELTRQVFIPNPLGNDPQDIVYKTGDLGRVLRDGNLEFLGRKDHQVKIRGVRVELAEIENTLRQQTAVRDVVVKDWEDAGRERFLCAYVVADQILDSQELRAFLLQSLPESMTPSFFVQLNKLPRTLSGKVDRKALPRPDEQLRAKTAYVAPRNEIESRLAEIWQTVLPVEIIGVNDNFFEIGGHSLRGTQVMSKIHREFQVDLPLRTLFDHATIAGLASAIVAERVAQADSQRAAQVLTEIMQLAEQDVHAALAVEKQPPPTGDNP